MAIGLVTMAAAAPASRCATARRIAAMAAGALESSGLLGRAVTVPFCVVDPATGQALGITTYLDIRPAHRGLEIGWTWYSPRARGTAINPACKLLLLGHAFERLGAIRVCLKTDERNARSRAAIFKLGAKFEGVMRENLIMPDGFHRSTAMYGVLAGEWPGVRRALEARLA